MSHCQNGVYCVFPRDCMCRCAGCNPLRPGQVESRFDPLGCDSSTGGELGTVHGVLPQVYPEDGLEVVLIGQVPGTAMPLEPEEAKVAFKIERPAYPPWRAWGILDEFDTLYEIREKV